MARGEYEFGANYPLFFGAQRAGQPVHFWWETGPKGVIYRIAWAEGFRPPGVYPTRESAVRVAERMP